MSTEAILRAKHYSEGKFAVVDIPMDGSITGRFDPLLDQVALLPIGKCVQLARLKIGEVGLVREAARRRGFRVAVRNTPEATYVWKKEAKQ